MRRIFLFILALAASAGTLFAESGTCGENIKEVGGGATGIETIDNGQLTTDIQKVIRDGKIYIIRDGKTYSVTGQEVK